MKLQDAVIERVMSLDNYIQTERDARDYLDLLTNSEMLALISNSIDELEELAL